ncbi:MAG: LON peptidase substrate-binding domain-containing protein [Pseudomonadota bacterium]
MDDRLMSDEEKQTSLGEAVDQNLSPVIPVFPLTGAVMLPGGELPLNIFEPRYLAMVRDAMAHHRLVGMAQPNERATNPTAGPDSPPPVFSIGCVGRISQFSETDDGRFLITLTGLSRFEIIRELDTTTPYRQFEVDYAKFTADRAADGDRSEIDRGRLKAALMAYMDDKGLTADWDAIDAAPADMLVNSLAMICPFGAAEKQALLEAPTVSERADTMITLMSFSLADMGSPSDQVN